MHAFWIIKEHVADIKNLSDTENEKAKSNLSKFLMHEHDTIGMYGLKYSNLE